MEVRGELMNDEELSELRARVRDHSLSNTRDVKLESQVREMIENVGDISKGRGSRKRSLFVIGRSGSGKSFSLEKLFARLPQFQPHENEYGELVTPLLSVEAEEGGIVNLCNRILKKLKLPENSGMKPAFALGLIKSVLPQHGVTYLHVDEAQDLMKNKTPYAVMQMQVQLKSLVQTPEWPLHTIYSGVDTLATLLDTDDDQLSKRAHVCRFGDLVLPADIKVIRDVVKKVAVELCGLDLSEEILEEDFIGRIWTASTAAYGTSIETVQEACFLALKNSHRMLEKKHFARRYELHRGCLPDDNVFSSDAWADIKPQNALADLNGPKRKRK